MHLAESRQINKFDQQLIYQLSQEFMVSFPQLYTNRRCVRVVHSVIHIADTVHDFGPLSNYTSFQFENDLGKNIYIVSNKCIFIFFFIGMLVRSTQGFRNQAQEMSKNLNIFQHAIRHSNTSTVNTDLAAFLSSKLIPSHHFPNHEDLMTHNFKKEDSAVRALFSQSNLQYFSILHIRGTRLTTRAYAHGKTSDDSNILFPLNGIESFGRIRSIFTVNGGSPILFVANLLNVTPLVYCIDSSTTYEYPGIQTASKHISSFVLVDVKDFIEKPTFF